MSRSGRPPQIRRAVLLVGHGRRLPGKFARPIRGTPILLREVRELRRAGLEVAVASVGAVEIAGVLALPDRYDAGPLGGLATALERFRPPFFVFGGDMPFLDHRAIVRMAEAFDGRSVVPVSSDGTWQVLHAIYARLRRSEVARGVRNGNGLKELVRAMDGRGEVRWLTAGTLPDRVFVDIDTPADYERWSGRRNAPSSRERVPAGRRIDGSRPPRRASPPARRRGPRRPRRS